MPFFVSQPSGLLESPSNLTLGRSEKNNTKGGLGKCEGIFSLIWIK